MKLFTSIVLLALISVTHAACGSRDKSQDEIETVEESGEDKTTAPEDPKDGSSKDQTKYPGNENGTGDGTKPSPDKAPPQPLPYCSWKGIPIPDQKWAYDSAALKPFAQCVSGSLVTSDIKPPTMDILDLSVEKSCNFSGKVVFDNLWAEVISTPAAYKFCRCDNGAFPQASCSNTRPDVPEANIIKI